MARPDGIPHHHCTDAVYFTGIPSDRRCWQVDLLIRLLPSEREEPLLRSSSHLAQIERCQCREIWAVFIDRRVSLPE